MDAGDANTWANGNQIKTDHSYSFFHLASRKIKYTFRIPSLINSLYSRRENAVVVHGGGWGLGNFIQKTAVLEKKEYCRKIIIKNLSDFNPAQKKSVYYLNDPDWDPLTNENPANIFPPLGRIINNNHIEYVYFPDHHASLKLINESKAVISKPGGMTLADAIITETPFIYLEPMGANEEGNKILIDQYKIGTSFNEWEKNGFSDQRLQEFHINIGRLKKNLPDFVSGYINDLKNTGIEY